MKIHSYSNSIFVVHDDYAKLSVHPYGHFTCSGSNNGKVFLFPVDQGPAVETDHQHQCPVICSAFASNLLITGDTSGRVSFFVE